MGAYNISTFVGRAGLPLKWLNRGLRLERDDPGFKGRLDHVDSAISEQNW
jgi:hypothetical protein